MSSPLHRNDTSALRLLLNQLQQSNDVDHIDYRFWDFLHWFPTEQDEKDAWETAWAIPKDKRTKEQQKVIDRRDARDNAEQIAEDKARQYQQSRIYR